MTAIPQLAIGGPNDQAEIFNRNPVARRRSGLAVLTRKFTDALVFLRRWVKLIWRR
jgi:hypothetical protein